MNKIKLIMFALLIIIMTVPSAALAIPTVTGWHIPDSGTVGDLSDESFSAMITTLIRYLLGFVAVLALVGIVISGIMYMTAAGDEDRAETAKRVLTYSIVGLAVVLIGLVIVIAVDYIINAGDSVYD